MPEHDAFHVRTTATRTADVVQLTLTVTLPSNVHVEPHEPADPNLIPTVLTVEGLEDVAVTYPRPVSKDLGWNGISLTVLEGELEFQVTGRAIRDDAMLTGTLSYQPCVGGACLPPRTVTWQAPSTGTTAYSLLHALSATPPTTAHRARPGAGLAPLLALPS